MKRVMDEVNKSKQSQAAESTSGTSKPQKEKSVAETIFEARPPILTSDLFNCSALTNNAAGASLTSTSASTVTSSKTRCATQFEVEDSACAWLKSKKGKKSYGVLKTTLGDMMLEIDSDIVPKVSCGRP